MSCIWQQNENAYIHMHRTHVLITMQNESYGRNYHALVISASRHTSARLSSSYGVKLRSISL